MSVAFQTAARPSEGQAPESRAAAHPAPGNSPAAEALAARRPSRFAQLLKRLGAALSSAEAGGKPPAGEARRPKAATGSALAGAAPAGNARAPALVAPSPDGRTAEAPAPAPRARSRGGKSEKSGSLGEPAAAAAAVERRPGVPPAKAPAAGEVPPPVRVAGSGGPPSARKAPVKVVVIDLRRGEPENEPAPRAAPEEKDSPAWKLFERVRVGREAPAPREAAPDSPGQGPAGLWRSLQERLLPELVQRTAFVLRDGGEGELRLVLRPEHLGAVRVRVHLGESSLEGRFVVDNYNVKELLEANLEQLKNALRQEGFASANIEVSVSGGGDRQAAGRREPEPAGAPPVGRAAESFQRATPELWEAGLGFTTVNLFV